MFPSKKTAILFAASATPDLLPKGQEIFDLMPPHAMNTAWLAIISNSLLIILIVLLLNFFYYWLNKPISKSKRQIDASPKKMALRALKRLTLSPIWKNRQLKDICEVLAAILKNYIRDELMISIGSSATTDEFLSSLYNSSVKADLRKACSELLNECDFIKYSGKQSDSTEIELLLATVERLINIQEWTK